ncbi:MAG: sugar phosphorylase [Anaerolineae bacterium]|jgi:sucrose phosphorylase
MTPKERIREHLAFLYGTEATAMWQRLCARLDAFAAEHTELGQAPPPSERLSQRDAVLITYGDQFQQAGQAPLQTLAELAAQYLADVISAMHILPFYPYSSDDGFSVIDYRAVNPAFGAWTDVRRLGERFQLMFDAVINHISRQSEWFEGYLRDEAPYTGYFITVPEGADLSRVVRPRALPLLTEVQTAHGPAHVWTTFSEDQIDLNYADPDLMLEIIDLLLFYVGQGAEIIRLDAIAYLWKEFGTTCIHLPQTHAVVKLWRAVLDAVAPGVLLITETNVPHEENVSYFGQPLPGGGTDEAQLVYQFSLAPLIMHSILTGDATVLTRWADTLEPPAQATFFNFTASHDGVGVRPAEGLLTRTEIEALAAATIAHGGRASYKTDPAGTQSVYELNISYFDALSNPAVGEPLQVQVARFIVSQAIMLALAGVPGIYVHSLFGSRSWQEGVQQTGRNRTINRQKLDYCALLRELENPDALRHRVFDAYCVLLRVRRSEAAFHPFAAQRVLSLHPSIFALLRIARDGASRVLCLHNASDRMQQVEISIERLGTSATAWRDLLTGQDHAADSGLMVEVGPYGVCWLKALGASGEGTGAVS